MCPECREPMVAFELEGVEIDRCLRCRGTWLDTGELETLTELSGAEPGRLTQALTEARGTKHGQRRCPRCRRKLQIINVATDKPIELDRCPVGHGLWFFPDQMAALIKHYVEGEEGAVARFFIDLYRSEFEQSN